MAYIKKNEATLKDTWQIYFQAMVQLKADVYLYSKLDPKKVKNTHLEPVTNIDRLILDLVSRYGPNTRICILPEGPQTIPYLV